MSSSVSQISPFKLGVIDDTLEATDEAQSLLLNPNEKFIRGKRRNMIFTFRNLMFLELHGYTVKVETPVPSVNNSLF